METEAGLKAAAGVEWAAGAQALMAYLALAAGILCIAWSAIFVRWPDIPGVGVGLLPNADPRAGFAADISV